MKILYIAVHYYDNDTNWRSEGDINLLSNFPVNFFPIIDLANVKDTHPPIVTPKAA